MKWLRVVFVLIALSISSISWASFYHYNRYALQMAPDDKDFINLSGKEPKSGLVISGALDSDRSTNYFGAFNLVFENKSDQWMILRDIRISFISPEQNQNVSIPIGAQFSAWNQGMQNMDDYNNKKAAVIAGVLGGVLAAKGETRLDRGVGVITAGVSLAALASAKDYNEIIADLPPYHLLKGEIIIPPGLFMKRWLLLNSTGHKATGYIHTLALEFKDQDGKPQKYYLQFRSSTGSPSGNWQTEDFTVKGAANFGSDRDVDSKILFKDKH